MWDDSSYLAYAMSLGMDYDLDFSNEISRSWAPAPNGGPRHYYGAGLLAAPFVALFSLLDRVNDHPVIQDHNKFLHSWSYAGFSFAVHFYFLASVFLLWQSVGIFRKRAPPVAVLLLVVSSGIFYYVAVRSRMSHGFEFFALSLTTYAAVGIWKAIESRRNSLPSVLLAGFAVHLTLAVRPNDINVIGLPALIMALIYCCQKTEETNVTIRSLYRNLALQAVCFILVFVPFSGLNMLVYGAPYPTPATMGQVLPFQEGQATGIDFVAMVNKLLATLPSIPHVFFSAQFGLLYSNPVLPFGLLAMIVIFTRRYLKQRNAFFAIVLGATLLYFLFSFVITLLWVPPGFSYGYRFLYPLFPLAFMGCMGWWLNDGYLPTILGRHGRRWIMGVFVLLCLFSTSGAILFTKVESLTYNKVQQVTAIGNIPWAPDFNINLAREVVSHEAWDAAMKGGVYGFVLKSYLGKRKIRWFLQETFGYGDGSVKKPRTQHPPIVGKAILVLLFIWIGYIFVFLRAAARKENGVQCTS